MKYYQRRQREYGESVEEYCNRIGITIQDLIDEFGKKWVRMEKRFATQEYEWKEEIKAISNKPRTGHINVSGTTAEWLIPAIIIGVVLVGCPMVGLIL